MSDQPHASALISLVSIIWFMNTLSDQKLVLTNEHGVRLTHELQIDLILEI